MHVRHIVIKLHYDAEMFLAVIMMYCDERFPTA